MVQAVIKTGGKQYLVAVGNKIKVEKLETETGQDFIFDEVLLIGEGDSVKIGTPFISGAKVEAKVVRQMRDVKKIVFKYHQKTRYKKKHGHRQPLTEIEITKIS